MATALLAGCGGSQVAPTGGVPTGSAATSFPYHKTFNYTGAKQDFKVPAGVTHITVVALGAHGAGSPEAYGGRVYAVIPVTPGETLVVYVGGNGSGTTGGYNGGAAGGPRTLRGPGGAGGGNTGYGGGGGGGGSQISGGAGGRTRCYYYGEGGSGELGLGGNGGTPCEQGASGGGGGGYYGGGGGGSSYAERRATNVRFWQGWKKSAHNGLVVFSW